MGKKVGIITSYLDFDKNYGGALQAFALADIISSLGYDATIMPYIYESKQDASWYRQILKNARDGLYGLAKPQWNRQRIMRKQMLRYVHKTFPIYRKKRIRVAELKTISPQFHAFVCGSDQVWSTRLQKNHCDPGMFLTFVSRPVKKIAYAPSMGSTLSMTEETAQEFRQALSSFDAISVREKTGQKLIKTVTGKDVPLVLDPTLLLPVENWNVLEEKPKNLPEKYILLYRFGNLESTLRTVNEIAQKTGLPVIEIPSSAVALEDEYLKHYDVTPGTFIGMINNASLVCTDSFHATVFSILKKTPFISFYRQDPSMQFNMNARIDDLLEMTGLNARLVSVNDTVNYDTLLEMDFEEAHKRIGLLKQESLQYLIDNLEEKESE